MVRLKKPFSLSSRWDLGFDMFANICPSDVVIGDVVLRELPPAIQKISRTKDPPDEVLDAALVFIECGDVSTHHAQKTNKAFDVVVVTVSDTENLYKITVLGDLVQRFSQLDAGNAIVIRGLCISVDQAGKPRGTVGFRSSLEVSDPMKLEETWHGITTVEDMPILLEAGGRDAIAVSVFVLISGCVLLVFEIEFGLYGNLVSSKVNDSDDFVVVDCTGTFRCFFVFV